MYMPDNTQCSLWQSLGSLNNWREISFYDVHSSSTDTSSSTTKSIFRNTLRSRALSLLSMIEVGYFVAISTEDNKTFSGYYICSFKSVSYSLQRNYVNNRDIIPRGEPVCDITYLNPVSRCHTLFSHDMKDEESLNDIVRLQHVIDAYVVVSTLIIIIF